MFNVSMISILAILIVGVFIVSFVMRRFFRINIRKILIFIVILVLLAAAAFVFFVTRGVPMGPAKAEKPGATLDSTTPKENPNTPKEHIITVTDENGNGLANVVVQISSDSDESVAGGPTDENGVFSEELLKNDSYVITLMMVPKGYIAEESYTFTDMVANIVLQPAAD